MARRISRDADDRAAGLTFHNAPSRLNLSGMSFLAMQRYFDQVNRSIYLCSACGWRGRGRELAAMEQDGQDAYAFDFASDSWYACPTCEHEIALEAPLMRLVSAEPQADLVNDAAQIDIESTGSL